MVHLLAQGINVPPLSSRQIAAEADAVLREYSNHFGPIEQPPIEVEDIATTVLKLSVGFADLQNSYNDRVHGAIWFSRREIWIDSELNPERSPRLLGRFHFTLAHEIGHWVLHRFLFVDDNGRSSPMAASSFRKATSFWRRSTSERSGIVLATTIRRSVAAFRWTPRATRSAP